MSVNITWDEVLKKEARGINEYDLVEVQEVQGDTVVTKKGLVDKDKFFYPRIWPNDLTVTTFGSGSPKQMLKTTEETRVY